MATNRLVVKEEVATYASVLLDEACKAGGQDVALEVYDQLEAVTSAIRSAMGTTEVLVDPTIAADQRASLARGAFADCNPLLVDVLAVMAERADIELLPRVFNSYEEQLRNKLNLNVVDVTTAVSLNDELRQVITNKAAADLGTNVVLREHVDESILGGIIMSANGKRIDASVTSQLDHARIVLKQSTDGGEC